MDKHPKQIKYYLPWDNLPIDISFVFEKEKPAGKHGFLKTNGNGFVFEDGTPAKFWGSNFNSGACFPPKEHAPKLARRLAMLGLNIVRFHQMDSEWSRPSLFQYDKGPLLENTQTLDSRSLDLLDYFIYCLKNEGVYVYLDLLTYRRFREGDGIENASQMPDAGKPYCLYNRKMIELQKKFNRDLLTHYNPYTKLEYRQDPCIVLSEIVNETSFYYFDYGWPVELEPYRHELCEIYRNWAEEKGIEKKTDEELNFSEPDDVLNSFLIEMERKYATEMMDDLRDIGVKYPLTGNNQSIRMASALSQDVCDFVDNHEYMWLGTQIGFTNVNPLSVEQSFGTMLSMSALPDKPLFVSEWDTCWPNEYRAAAPLFVAGLISFQGWGGATVHAYRYGNNVEPWLTSRFGRELSLNGSFGRGCWDNYNDPAKFGLFYHASLIVRRGDIKPANETIAVNAEYPMDTRDTVTALRGAPEIHKVIIHEPGKSVEADHKANIHDEIYTEDEILSDTGEMFRNRKQGNGWIDTPMTKAVYGSRRRGEKVKLKGFEVESKDDFYTIAISSLDDKPISESSNLLLTAVGRADNKGAIYNGEHNSQIEQGEGPLQIDVIEASIEMDTDMERVHIMAIDYEGFLCGTLRPEVENGTVKFNIGDSRAMSSLYYLIQKG